MKKMIPYERKKILKDTNYKPNKKYFFVRILKILSKMH